ncbi:hypothetical protein ACFSO7_07970 [Bacillus sp. CGMCC 1.16607]|uniref:hypothetical protein n=1 Tax=Bacillus sp. CGMCC 1.16607 TaxID=3351842 RepID=UPI003631DB8A
MYKEITKNMLWEYNRLNEEKKKIEANLSEMKKIFNLYFDETVGFNEKGELLIEDLKLERQIRRVEKFDEVKTVDRLESLNMVDLVLTIKRPDEEKVKAALNLGLLKNEDLEGCISLQTTGAIYVKSRK